MTEPHDDSAARTPEALSQLPPSLALQEAQKEQVRARLRAAEETVDRALEELRALGSSLMDDVRTMRLRGKLQEASAAVAVHDARLQAERDAASLQLAKAAVAEGLAPDIEEQLRAAADAEQAKLPAQRAEMSERLAAQTAEREAGLAAEAKIREHRQLACMGAADAAMDRAIASWVRRGGPRPGEVEEVTWRAQAQHLLQQEIACVTPYAPLTVEWLAQSAESVVNTVLTGGQGQGPMGPFLLAARQGEMLGRYLQDGVVPGQQALEGLHFFKDVVVPPEPPHAAERPEAPRQHAASDPYPGPREQRARDNAACDELMAIAAENQKKARHREFREAAKEVVDELRATEARLSPAASPPPAAESRPVKGCYIGAPATFALETACRTVAEAFGVDCCYVVGSCLSRADWRDVDVRLIMNDEAFERTFPDTGEHWEHDARWLLLTVSISAWMKAQTGLPVDFQMQPMTAANKQHTGPRSAKGLRFVALHVRNSPGRGV